jgi:hypothetical protein
LLPKRKEKEYETGYEFGFRAVNDESRIGSINQIDVKRK